MKQRRNPLVRFHFNNIYVNKTRYFIRKLNAIKLVYSRYITKCVKTSSN